MSNQELSKGRRVGRRYRVAVNDDGASQWQYWQVPLGAEQFLRVAVDRVSDCDLLCWGVGNTRFWYNNSVAEDLDTGQQVFDSVGEWMAHTTLRSLRAAGCDPLALICDRCHERGMHLYASLRMNDGHFAFPPPDDAPDPDQPDFTVFHPDMLWNHQRGPERSPLTSQFWRRHPEFRIAEDWAGSRFAADLLDYAHAEVRALWVGIIADIAGRYDVDGIEMDFMRNPFFFKPQGVEAGHSLMTDFISQARKTLDEAGSRKGRHIGLAVRCPTSLTGCRAVGLDVSTWTAAGAIDVLIPSPARTNKFEIDLRPFVEMAHSTDCQVLAGVDTVMPNITWEQTRALRAEDITSAIADDPQLRVLAESRHKREQKRGVLEGMPVNLWRALAANAYGDGVDGIYVFNLWDQIVRHGRHLDCQILRDAREPQALARTDKLYALDFEIPGGGVGHPTAHLLQAASLPAVLEEGQPLHLKLKVADDLARVPAHQLAEVRLHLLVVNLTPVDVLRVQLNGQPIEQLAHAPTLEPAAPTGPHSAFVDLVVDLRQHPPKVGQNTFTLLLESKNRSVRPQVYLRELELSIRYGTDSDSR